MASDGMYSVSDLVLRLMNWAFTVLNEWQMFMQCCCDNVSLVPIESTLLESVHFKLKMNNKPVSSKH